MKQISGTSTANVMQGAFDRRSRSRHPLLSSCALASAILAISHPGLLLAQAFTGTPDVKLGDVSFDSRTVGGAETITIGSPTAIIDWAPTDTAVGGGAIDFLPNGHTATFANSSETQNYFTVLNRINPVDSSRAIALNGTVLSRLDRGAAGQVTGGAVWFSSPGGILVGGGAVIDVGSLVLTALNIETQSDTALFFNGPFGKQIKFKDKDAANIRAGVNIASGAQISASDQFSISGNDAYIAIVAPRINQAGSIAANGNVLLAAVESADVSINAGMFDIAINTGSDTDAGGETTLVHSGTTTGDVSNTSGSPGGIYLIAVPKNNAVTMLVTGNLGYSTANAAATENGSVVLLAGANLRVQDGPVGQSRSTSQAGAQVSANVDIVNADFSSNLAAGGNDFVHYTADSGTHILGGVVDISAGRDASVIVSGGATVDFGSSVGIYTVNESVTGSDLIGSAQFSVFDSQVTVNGNVVVSANKFTRATNVFAGNAGVLLRDANLDISGGSLTISANAFNGETSATGGSAALTLNQVGANAPSLTATDIVVSALGLGFTQTPRSYQPGTTVADAGGDGVGGSATITSAGAISTGSITITADGSGGNGDDPTNFGNDVIDGGAGGKGTGGLASLDVVSGTVNDDGTPTLITLTANGTGGIGGTPFESGYGVGTGGNGGAGGEAIGGRSQIDLRGGSIDSHDMLVQAFGEGGAGGDAPSGSGGVGGTGTAGLKNAGNGATIAITGGTLTAVKLMQQTDAAVVVGASGFGGTGGSSFASGSGADGGMARAGYAHVSLGAGNASLDSILIRSNATGGDGGNSSSGAAGAGGDAFGGAGFDNDRQHPIGGAFLAVDSGTIAVSSELSLSANAMGGDGGSTGGSSNGGKGGQATGGYSEISVNGGTIANAAGAVINVTANAAGGDGGGSSAGGGGDGGNAFAGNGSDANFNPTGGASILINSGAIAFSPDALISAIAIGGSGGGNAFGPAGNGGRALGGMASFTSAGGTSEFADLQINVTARGGRAGSAEDNNNGIGGAAGDVGLSESGAFGLVNLGGGLVTVSRLLMRADATAGESFDSPAGSNSFAGNLTNQVGGGRLTITNELTMSASGHVGDAISQVSGNSGAVFGGFVQLLVLPGGDLEFASDTTLTMAADAFAGGSLTSGIGGVAFAGQIHFTLGTDSIDSLSSINLSAQASGGQGYNSNGIGGEARGGFVLLDAEAGSISVDGNISVNVSAVGGSGAQGGNASGPLGAGIEQIRIFTRGGQISATSLTANADGRGGNSAENFNGGNGQGGTILLDADSASIGSGDGTQGLEFASIFLSATGNGGNANEQGYGSGGGAVGGAGTGGTISLLAGRDKISTTSQTLIFAVGNGGDGFDASGGDGNGGTIVIGTTQSTNGTPLIDLTGFSAGAHGFGGDANANGSTVAQGNGGDGVGGIITLESSKGSVTIASISGSIAAIGGGGDGQSGTSAVVGNGGSGFGGSIALIGNGGILSLPSTIGQRLQATGFGGAGGDSADGFLEAGRGGNAFGGVVSLIANNAVNGIDTLGAEVFAFAGDGGDAAQGRGGAGGSAFGGNVTISVNGANGKIDISQLDIIAFTDGGDGGDGGSDPNSGNGSSGGFGGNASGGTISFNVAEGSLIINDLSGIGPSIDLFAIGGQGGRGGAAITGEGTTTDGLGGSGGNAFGGLIFATVGNGLAAPVGGSIFFGDTHFVVSALGGVTGLDGADNISNAVPNSFGNGGDIEFKIFDAPGHAGSIAIGSLTTEIGGLREFRSGNIVVQAASNGGQIHFEDQGTSTDPSAGLTLENWFFNTEQSFSDVYFQFDNRVMAITGDLDITHGNTIQMSSKDNGFLYVGGAANLGAVETTIARDSLNVGNTIIVHDELTATGNNFLASNNSSILTQVGQLTISVDNTLAIGFASSASDLMLRSDFGSVQLVGAIANDNLNLLASESITSTFSLTAGLDLTAMASAVSLNAAYVGDDTTITANGAVVLNTLLRLGTRTNDADGSNLVIGGTVTTVNSTDALTADGDIDITASGAITLVNLSVGDDIRITTGGPFSANNITTLALPGRDIDGNGSDLTITGIGGNPFAIAGTITVADDISIVTNGDVNIIGTTTAGDDVTIDTQLGSNASITTAALIASGTTPSTGGADITILASGDIDISSAQSGDEIEIEAFNGGSITVGMANATGSNADSDGANISLDTTGTIVANMLTAATDLIINDGNHANGSVTITNLASAGDDILIFSSSASLANVSAIDGIEISADAGNISITSATAGDDVFLATIGTFGNIVAVSLTATGLTPSPDTGGADVRLNSAGLIDVGSASAGDEIDFRAVTDVIIGTAIATGTAPDSDGSNIAINAERDVFATTLEADNNINIVGDDIAIASATAGTNVDIVGVTGINISGAAVAGNDISLTADGPIFAQSLIGQADANNIGEDLSSVYLRSLTGDVIAENVTSIGGMDIQAAGSVELGTVRLTQALRVSALRDVNRMGDVLANQSINVIAQNVDFAKLVSSGNVINIEAAGAITGLDASAGDGIAFLAGSFVTVDNLVAGTANGQFPGLNPRSIAIEAASDISVDSANAQNLIGFVSRTGSIDLIDGRAVNGIYLLSGDDVSVGPNLRPLQPINSIVTNGAFYVADQSMVDLLGPNRDVSLLAGLTPVALTGGFGADGGIISGNSVINAANGISLTSLQASGNVQLGSTAGIIEGGSVSGATGINVAGRSIDIGTLASSAGSVSINGAIGIRGLDINAFGDITLTSGGVVRIDGNASAGDDIRITTPGNITANGLTSRGTGPESGTEINGSDIILSGSSGIISITTAIAADDLLIDNPNASQIFVHAGTTTGTSIENESILLLRAITGNVQADILDGAGSVVAIARNVNVGSVSARNDFIANGSQSLALAIQAVAGDDIQMTANGPLFVGSARTTGLGLDADGLGSRIFLRTNNGQSPSSPSSGSLEAQNIEAQGDAIIDAVGNITLGTIVAGTNLDVFSPGAVSYGTLTSRIGDIDVSADGGTLTGGNVTAGNGIAMSALGDLAIGDLVAGTSTTNFTVLPDKALGDFSIGIRADGNVTVGSVTAENLAAIVSDNGTITTGSLRAKNGIALLSQGNVAIADAQSGGFFYVGNPSIIEQLGEPVDIGLLSVLPPINTNGDFVADGAVSANAISINTAGGLSLGSIASTGDLKLVSDGAIAVTNNLQASGAIIVEGTSVTLNSAGSLNIARATATEGALSITTAGSLLLAEAIANGNASLLSSGDLSIGTLTASGTVLARAGQNLAISSAVGENSLSFSAGLDLAAANVTSKTGSITLEAGAIQAQSGATSYSPLGDASITGTIDAPTRVAIRAGGDISLGSASVLRSDGTITVQAGNLLTVAPGAVLGIASQLPLSVDKRPAANASNSASSVLLEGGNLIINGFVGGSTITVRSGAIEIGSSGSIGTINTQSLFLINTGTSRTTLGGTGASGYSLSSTELARLHAALIRISGAGLGTAGGVADVSVLGFDLNGSGTPATSQSSANITGSSARFSIDTIGDVQISGPVRLNNAGSGDIFSIAAGSRIDVFAPEGSIIVRNAGGLLAGRIGLSAGTVFVGTPQAASDLAGLTDANLIDQRLANSSGLSNPEGFLQANSLDFDIGRGLFIQNSNGQLGSGVRSGLLIGPDGRISIFGDDGSEIFINGRISGEGGSFTGGASLIPAIFFNGEPIDGDSAIAGRTNGCVIATNVCFSTDMSQMLPPVQNVFDVVAPSSSAGGESFANNDSFATAASAAGPSEAGEAGDEGAPAESSISVGSPLIQLVGVGGFAMDGLIDEPITGAGNDGLWDTLDDRDKIGSNGL